MQHPIVAGRCHGYRDTETLTGEEVAATWGVKQVRTSAMKGLGGEGPWWRSWVLWREGIHTRHIRTLAEPTLKRSMKSGGLHLDAFVLLRLEDQLAKRAQKEELMVQINGGACFHSSAAESVSTSVLIMSTDSWHQTADRYWRICFISSECLHEDHLLHLWVRPCQYLHPHNRTMFTLNSFSSLYPTMKR